jgi:hypothetical protein
LAVGILDKYRSQYRVSIEDFAEQVKVFVERQSPDFRLNFFVDEVGQYISDNVKLMTNLQTIAESLATKCRGRAWVIVTAQEDMTTVVGEMSRQQGNDFTKIQARFSCRMKLTSTDVAEVIQKRLLTKTEEGVQILSGIYHAEANNFKTLFDFADGSVSYRNFQDRDHFIHSYPFIPYQFALFQSAIQNLSLHNAFEGKHSSVGERSMLGVFQQVAIQICDRDVGQIATFDLMFEGIRTALKSNIQRAILQAEKHLESPYAIRVLKALFLIKYVKEFKATHRNLSVLMLDGVKQDLPLHRKKVEEALNLLEQQVYVQRTGELYEYLTDEEKDIEQEIKNTEVESAEVAAELDRLIFDHVIKNRKIRYDENGQDYPYSRKLDDRLHGREYELTIHVISPFHDKVEDLNTLVRNSWGRDELLIAMPPDDRLVRDLLMVKRTEKYIRQNISITQQDSVKRILTDKGFQNRERSTELQDRVQSLLSKAKLFVAGTDAEIAGEDPQTRITRGFHVLIARAYPNLRMLRGIAYTENDIAKILKHSQEGLFGNDATPLAESEQELLAAIQSNSRTGVRTTLKSLLEVFERKPYGWSYPAVLCTLANLCARGKIEVRSDGDIFEDDELERALRNTHGHGNVILEPQVDFTASQVRALKEFYEDFFDCPARANEAKALGKEAGVALQEMMHQLMTFAAQTAQYPFLSALTAVVTKLKDASGKPYTWYLTELPREREILLDMKEGIIDPIRKFMSGPQKAIFDSARKFVQVQEPNFDYIRKDTSETSEMCESGAPDPMSESLKALLFDPECFKGARIQQVKTLVENLQEKVSVQLTEEIAAAKKTVETLKTRLCEMPDFLSLSPDRRTVIERTFDEFSASLERQKLIAVIRDTLRRFEESDYLDLLAKLCPTEKSTGTAAPNPHTTKGAASPAKRSVQHLRSIVVPYGKAWLADETDVECYLGVLREALLTEIKNGRKVQI